MLKSLVIIITSWQWRCTRPTNGRLFVEFSLIGENVEERIFETFKSNIGEHALRANLTRAKVLNTRNLQISDETLGGQNKFTFRGFTKKSNGKKILLFVQEAKSGVLLPDGNVSICCQDYALEGIRGNLGRETLTDIYNKIEIGEDKDQFLSGKFRPCVNCEHYKPVGSSFTGHA